MTPTARAAALFGALVLLAGFAREAAAQNWRDRLRRAAGAAVAIGRTLLPISTAKEIEIGRGVAATIAGRFSISGDADLTRYVNLVGLAVAGEAPRPDLAYRFAVLETPLVNAFAAPGGYVFITRGALGLIESEAELAGVLAHEVAHVNRRHVIEQIRKSDIMREVRDQLELTGSRLDRVIGTGANALFMGLSREDELEADSLGFEYAAGVGYDPGGLAAFVARLERQGGEGPLAEFFATHPRPAERLQSLSRIAQRAAYPPGPVLAERFRASLRRP